MSYFSSGILHHFPDDPLCPSSAPPETIDPGTEGCDYGDEVLHDVGLIILGPVDDLQPPIRQWKEGFDIVGTDPDQSVLMFDHQDIEVGIDEDLQYLGPMIVYSRPDLLDDLGDHISLGTTELSKSFGLSI